jgi:hypothetical protein
MQPKLNAINKLLFAATTLILAFTLLAPAQIAFAQEEDPPQGAARHEPWKARLSRIYQRELNLLEKQAERLDNTANVVAKVEAMIERAREKGLDVSGLEAALAAYQSTVAEARVAHDEAAETLRTHTGFDDDGKVTNVEEAVRTVNQARKTLTQVHRLLDRAGRTLRLDIRRWIIQQRPINDAG